MAIGEAIGRLSAKNKIRPISEVIAGWQNVGWSFGQNRENNTADFSNR